MHLITDIVLWTFYFSFFDGSLVFLKPTHNAVNHKTWFELLLPGPV